MAASRRRGFGPLLDPRPALDGPPATRNGHIRDEDQLPLVKHQEINSSCATLIPEFDIVSLCVSRREPASCGSACVR